MGLQIEIHRKNRPKKTNGSGLWTAHGNLKKRLKQGI